MPQVDFSEADSATLMRMKEEGHTNRQIGQKLGRSDASVEGHIQYQKRKANGTAVVKGPLAGTRHRWSESLVDELIRLAEANRYGKNRMFVNWKRVNEQISDPYGAKACEAKYKKLRKENKLPKGAPDAADADDSVEDPGASVEDPSDSVEDFDAMMDYEHDRSKYADFDPHNDLFDDDPMVYSHLDHITGDEFDFNFTHTEADFYWEETPGTSQGYGTLPAPTSDTTRAVPGREAWRQSAREPTPSSSRSSSRSQGQKTNKSGLSRSQQMSRHS
jgi:hypothetical protein